MAELFSYRKRQSLCEKVNPAAKIIFLLGFSSFVMLISRLWIQVACLVLTGIAMVFGCRMRTADLGRLIRLFLAFTVGYFLLQAILIRDGATVLTAGGVRITNTGITTASTVALRMVNLVLGAMCFVETTEPKAFGVSLYKELRIPYFFSIMLFLCLRSLPRFEATATEIEESFRARGYHGRSSLRWRLWRTAFLMKILLFRGFREARVLACSLDSRAFRSQPRPTFYSEYPVMWYDVLIAIGGMLLFLAPLCLRQFGGHS